MRHLPSLLLLGLLACGDSSSPGGTGETAGQGGSSPIPGPTCAATATQHPLAPTTHVDVCSPTPNDAYTSDPPSSGNHYGVWAAFRTYTQPVPRGHYLHSMEHGAVVFLYNCPEGCDADVAVLQSVIDALPADPECTAPGGPRRRVILTPDPRLPVRFAAAAWGWTLTAPCPDPAAFDAFARAHYAEAPEDFCSDGTDVIAAGVPAGCGE